METMPASRPRPFEDVLADLAAYARQHGHTRVPAAHRTPDGYGLGAWVERQRRRHRHGRLAPEQAAALDAIGMEWSPSTADAAPGGAHDKAFQAAYDRLVAYKAEHGNANPPLRYRTPDGYTLGMWVARRRERHRKGVLPTRHHAALVALGVTFDTDEVRAAGYAAPTRANAPAARRAQKWHRALHAAQHHVESGGSLATVASTDTTKDGKPLGRWLYQALHAHQDGALPVEVAAPLATLGLVFEDPAVREARLRQARLVQRVCAGVACYAAVHGHTNIPATYRDARGYWLGRALRSLRQQASAGTLPAVHREALASVGVAVPDAGQSLTDAARQAGSPRTGRPAAAGLDRRDALRS